MLLSMDLSAVLLMLISMSFSLDISAFLSYVASESAIVGAPKDL